MPTKKSTHIFLFILFGVMPYRVQADLLSDWDMNWGVSSFNYRYSNEINVNVDIHNYLEFNYSLIQPSLRSALTFSFAEALSAEGVSLPFTRFAVGGRHYFMGLGSQRHLVESGVEVRERRAIPFVAFNVGLSNLSMPGLNASFIDYALRGGVEIPLTSRFTLLGQVGLGGDLLSSGNAEEQVRYSTFDLFMGFRILPKFWFAFCV